LVIAKVIKWAKKNIDEYGAEAICLKLTRINPDVASAGLGRKVLKNGPLC
jgi:CO dehydrogenase/acetyl-CoA synthase delta subunit